MQLFYTRQTFIVLLLLLPLLSDAQPGFSYQPSRTPDTICFPFVSGLRMIMVDHEGRRRREVDWLEGTKPRGMSWDAITPPSPLNEYYFLDSSGRVVKSFNVFPKDRKQVNNVFSQFRCGPAVKENPTDRTISRQWKGAFKRGGLHTEKYGNNPAPGMYRVSNIHINKLRASGWPGRSDDQIGLIDAAGEWVLPMSYSYIESAGPYFLVYKKGLAGLIKRNLEEIIPVAFAKVEQPKEQLYVFSNSSGPVCSYELASGEKKDLRMYDWIDKNALSYGVDESRPIVVYGKGDKLGFLKHNLSKVTEPVYDYALGYFRDGLAPVCRDGKWGYVNGKGMEVIPCIYNDAVPFDKGKAKVQQDGELFCIDTLGRRISNADCTVYYVIEEKPTWRDQRLDQSGIRFVKRNGEYGGLDASGKIIIPFIYSSIHGIPLKNNFQKCRTDLFQVKKGTGWGIIRANGSTVLPCIYDEIRDYAGYMMVMQKEGEVYGKQKVGLLTHDFTWIFPCVYQSILPNLIPNLFVFNKDSLMGIMDRYEKIILPPTYQQISWLKNGLAPVKKDGKYGMIDSLGHERIPAIYEQIGQEFNRNRIQVMKNGKWGCIDSLSNMIIPFLYDEIGSFEKPVAYIKKDNKIAFINLRGELVTEWAYDQVRYRWEPDGLMGVVRNSKIGFVDETGTLVIPCIYDEVTGYSKEGHMVRKDGRWMRIKRP